MTHGVDCGFLVYNERTYPRLIALFAELGVDTAASDMSFSAQVPDAGIEWGGANLDAVFAQRANLVRSAFLRMLDDVIRFNRVATELATKGAGTRAGPNDDSVGDFLDAHRFSAAFRDWYFLPMIGCIWSCPTEQMLRFPIGDARLGSAVRRIRRLPIDELAFGADYAETLRRGRERFLAQDGAVRTLGFDTAFMRTWEFYLAYCEAAFDTGITNVVQFTLRRA